jgi:hypothetical protein
MKNKIITCCLISCFLVVFGAIGANATITTYTHSAAFFTALGSTPYLTETYENIAFNTVIHPGDTLNGITYNSFPAPLGGRIDHIYWSLGDAGLALERAPDKNKNPQDFFKQGESFSVTFPWEVTAVSIYFIANPTTGNDLFIATPEGTAWTGGTVANYDVTFFNSNGSSAGGAFFAGLISDTPFTTATFGSRSAPYGSVFTVDNLTYTPVPGTLLLLGSGLAGLGLFRLRRRFKA